MRIVISESNGKSHQTEIAKDKEAMIIGKKIGEALDGNLIGAAGYVLELCGGSDSSGVPMRSDVAGSAKKFSLMSDGVGFHASDKGARRRKYVRGGTYSTEIVQVNTKVKQAGASPLDQLFPKQEKKEKK
jgi:small subunit ribosomal protein S6e